MTSQVEQDVEPLAYFDRLNRSWMVYIPSNMPVRFDEIFDTLLVHLDDDGIPAAIVRYRHAATDGSPEVDAACTPNGKELPVELAHLSTIELASRLRDGRMVNFYFGIVLHCNVDRFDDCRKGHDRTYYVISNWKKSRDPLLLVYVEHDGVKRKLPCESVDDIRVLVDENDAVIIAYIDTPDMKNRVKAWRKQGKIIVWKLSARLQLAYPLRSSKR